MPGGGGERKWKVLSMNLRGFDDGERIKNTYKLASSGLVLREVSMVFEEVTCQGL
jgi:hypothetical protein